MELVPLRRNTVALTTLALLAALGIVVRVFVRIPLIFGVVELTPGFLFSLLGGVIGGVPGGILVGAITGLGGAMALAEPPLLPIIGNVCLGIGSGYAIHVASSRDSLSYILLVIIGAPIIGGFMPTFLISALYGITIELATISALADTVQTLIWVVPAILLERFLIRTLIGHYIYPVSYNLELTEMEGGLQ
ncbi:MAG: hypothetical protein ACFFCP_04220 [Promethearchaeota archaeon]